MGYEMTEAAQPHEQPVRRRPFEAIMEREAEQQQLRRVLHSAKSGTGGPAVVRGPSGIGKSRLLDDVYHAARMDGFTALRAAGGRLERDYPFGVVFSLFERFLPETADSPRPALFRGQAELAAPLFGNTGSRLRSLAPTDEFTLLHGLYWCVVNLTELAPVALVIDDVQWADDLSLRFLIYLARRLKDLPLSLFIGFRSEGNSEDSELVADLLDAVSDGAQCQPRELTREGVRQLLAVVGEAAADPRLAGPAWEITRGNPLLVRELIAGIEDRPGGWRAITPDDIRHFAPESIARRVAVRLAEIGPAAESLARAASVLGEGCGLVAVARLADVDLDTAAAVAQRLMSAQVWANLDPVRFVHPVIQAAVYADMPAENRLLAHERAAWHLRQAGASAERVGGHLLIASPSNRDWVRAALHEAGRAAALKGAPEQAMKYLRRALETSPARSRDAELLLDLGLVEAAAGESTSIERFIEALADLDTLTKRTEALYALGQTLFCYGRHEEAAVAFREGVGLFAESDREAALQFESGLLCSGAYVVSLYAESWQRLEALAGQILAHDAHSPAERAVLAVLAMCRASEKPPAAAAAALAHLALDGGAPIGHGSVHSLEANLSMIALVWAGRPQDVLGPSEGALSAARRAGSVLAFTDVSFCRAQALHRLGRISEAIADAEAAVEGTRRGWRATAPAPHALLADCLLQCGDFAGAERILDEAETFLAGKHSRGPNSWFYWARGRASLLQGEPSKALDDLLHAGQILREYGMSSPAVVPWRSSAIRAAIAVGDRGLAEHLLRVEVDLSERFGLRDHRAIALCLEAGLRDDDQSVAMLDQAIGELREMDRPVDLAAALVQLGELYLARTMAVKARGPLREALDLAHQAGAGLLEHEALGQLHASGARPRRARTSGLEALTPSERRVVQLAVEGASNRGIAERLFLTKNTVEWHLRNSYRKLGITCRSELQEAVTARAAVHGGDIEES
jgi:tetratricopeptide (TPR) repeat protein